MTWSKVLLPFTSKVLSAKAPMMKLSVQGVKAAKGQPDFLAGKDTVHMQTLPLHCLCYPVFLWFLWSRAAAERGAEPLCLAALPWASSNLRVREWKGKCAVSSCSWIDMTEWSCSLMRGTVKSWLGFFLTDEITSVLFQGTKTTVNAQVTTGKYFEMSVLIPVPVEKLAQKPLYLLMRGKKDEKTNPDSCLPLHSPCSGKHQT